MIEIIYFVIFEFIIFKRFRSIRATTIFQVDIGGTHIIVKDDDNAEEKPKPIEKVKYMKTTEINGLKLTQMVEEDAYGSPEVPLAYAKELDELDENLIKVLHYFL